MGRLERGWAAPAQADDARVGCDGARSVEATESDDVARLPDALTGGFRGWARAFR